MAAAYALRDRAPFIFKELLKDHAINKDLSGRPLANQNGITKESANQSSTKKVQEEAKLNQNVSPMKIVGQKRVEAPSVLSQEILTPLKDSLMPSSVERNLDHEMPLLDDSRSIKISDPMLLKRKELFSKYTPYTVSIV
jgi:hypothetical protein